MNKKAKKTYIPGLGTQPARGYGVYTDSATGTVVINVLMSYNFNLSIIIFSLHVIFNNKFFSSQRLMDKGSFILRGKEELVMNLSLLS